MAYKNLPKSEHGRGFRAPVSDEDQKITFRQRHPWATFLAGSWQREKPQREGCYPIADRAGRFRGFRNFAAGQDLQAPPGEPGWAGWIWSEPLPEPPKAADDWFAVPVLEVVKSDSSQN